MTFSNELGIITTNDSANSKGPQRKPRDVHDTRKSLGHVINVRTVGDTYSSTYHGWYVAE